MILVALRGRRIGLSSNILDADSSPAVLPSAPVRRPRRGTAHDARSLAGDPGPRARFAIVRGHVYRVSSRADSLDRKDVRTTRFPVRIACGCGAGCSGGHPLNASYDHQTAPFVAAGRSYPRRLAPFSSVAGGTAMPLMASGTSSISFQGQE